MFYKLGKEIFKLLINFLQFIRVLLVFLAFATVLYWLMQLGGATFFDFITTFFESIKNFMHLFYTRTVTIDTTAIDFSFLLAIFIMLGISWGLKPVVETLEFAETKYDSYYLAFKKKAEMVFNVGLEHHYVSEENKNKNFLILIKICALNLAKDSNFNKDISVGVDEKQQEILNELSKRIVARFKCATKRAENELLISFRPFNQIDDVLLELQRITKELANRNKPEKWKIDSIIAVETYAKEDEIAAKLINLKKLVRLGLKNEIACLSTFNQRYLLLEKPKFKIEGKGIYTINDKEETVFCIERISST